MALLQIIDTFCEKTGWDPVNQRDAVVKIINRAAKEVYEFTDLPGCLKEIVVQALPNNVIALPYYVGELRAMRNYYGYGKLIAREMAQKYSYQPWNEIWQNWRVLKKSPIQRSVESALQPLVFSIESADSIDCVINIAGSTLEAHRVTEQIIIAAGDTEVSPTNLFTDITSISKEAVNNKDITVTGRDEDNTADITLAEIPNDRLDSIYTIVDVSKLPSGGDAGTSYRYVETLYKEPLAYLSNDGDCFPCDGFDDAIAYKALEHEASEKENGGEVALGWYQKCVQIINQRTVHTNGSTQKMLIMGPNQYFGLYPKYAYGGRRRGYGAYPA